MYRKRAIAKLTIDNKTIKHWKKNVLDIHIRSVVPAFESSLLNDVAIIVKTHTHTHTHAAELR